MVKTPLTNHFPLEDSQDFLSVNFYPYDAEKIITTYKELKKKVTRIFPMEKKVTFPVIQGVKQAFLGLVKCKDFVSILSDSDDNMLTNIFEDNVRDFQGYNIVNSEIQSTIENCEDQARFGLLNNGITMEVRRAKNFAPYRYEENGGGGSVVEIETETEKYSLVFRNMSGTTQLEIGGILYDIREPENIPFEETYDMAVERHGVRTPWD